MTNPTPLSPAAQAVLGAYYKGLEATSSDCASEEDALAAALRAVADQSSYCLDGSDYYVIAKGDILAIAAELEGNHTSEND